VFISKIRKNHTQGNYYFWYQVDTGGKRTIVKGTQKEVADKREALIKKYQNEYIKQGS
jgi:predicted transcriptional regulator